MSEQSGRSDKDLEEQVRERNEKMPAETALGNADPAGGGEGDPKDYKGDQNAPE